MCYYISQSSQYFLKILGKSKCKCGTIVDLFLPILQKLPTIDFYCCKMQDDQVIKLFNTFTSEGQVLTNLLLTKRYVCKKSF